jgi:hypothetical protein
MSDKKTNTQGGKRANSGRLPLYTEQTIQIGFKVPISAVNDVKQAVNKVLEPLKIQRAKINQK